MAMSLELNLRILRAVLVLMGIGVGAYILGPPLYWHVAEALARNAADCGPCSCDCSSQPLLSVVEGNFTVVFEAKLIPFLLDLCIIRSPRGNLYVKFGFCFFICGILNNMFKSQ